MSAPIFHFDLGSSFVVGRTVFFGDDRLDEAVAAMGKPIA